MSEEIFWTIGFRKVWHKRSRQTWVFLENGNTICKPLRSLKDKDIKKLLKFSSMEETDKVIKEVREQLIRDGKQFYSNIANFTPLQISSVKNVKSNTEG